MAWPSSCLFGARGNAFRCFLLVRDEFRNDAEAHRLRDSDLSVRTNFGLGRVQRLVDLSRALQRVVDTGTDILCADVAFEIRLLHQLGGLLARSAEQERSP